MTETGQTAHVTIDFMYGNDAVWSFYVPVDMAIQLRNTLVDFLKDKEVGA